MTTYPTGWGERLKGLRRDLGLNAEALADRLNVTPQAVYRWEAGARVPDVATQVRIAEALGTTVTELFPRTPDEANLPDLARRCTGPKADS